MRGNETVLHDISFQVAAGESVAILGPNGCGKSTLIKLLTCELYPLAQPGMHLRIFGRERWDVTELRRRMGLVSADPPVRDALHVPAVEIVLSGFFSAARLWPHLRVTPEMREAAMAAMDALGIPHMAERPLQAMSAGQQKRVMIARALASSGDGNGRRVLLLDEAANTLDLLARRELQAALRSLARQGVSILLVTHHVEEIFPEMRRVLLMRDGRIMADGPTTDLLTSAHLSSVFSAPVQVEERDGSYFAH